MRALVVHDTSYGNTTKIAEAIRAGLGGDAKAREVETLDIESHARFDLYVVGSPTQEGTRHAIDPYLARENTW